MSLYPCKKHSAFYYETATPGDVVSFEAPKALPILKGSFTIEGSQSGSGDPSPTNVRPITGFTGMNIHVADGEEPHVVDNVTAVTWSSSGTIYGGYLLVKANGSAELWKTWGMVDLGDLSWTYQDNLVRFYTNELANVVKRPSSPTEIARALCSCYVINSYNNYTDLEFSFATSGNLFLKDSNYTDGTDLATARTGQKIVYELATPTKTDLSDVDITTLIGENNIFSDTGSITELLYRIK